MDSTRREVLTTAALAAAPLFVPRKAWGANDRITFGLIGAGGRGRGLARMFVKLGCEQVAISEVYQPNLELAQTDVPQAKAYLDYHELLAQKGLDAVVVATPDHQHAPNLYAALKARRDVYLEKPMSLSLDQSREMVNAVRATKQVVQIGMQRRSAPAIIKAREMVLSGQLGKITMVKPQWNWNIAAELDNTPLPGKLDWKRFLGTARDRELQPMRFRRWRYFWDYSGGNMTDQGTHLMDVVQWFTGKTAPKSAVCIGQVAKMTGAQTPDVFSAVFDYGDFMATWTLNYCNSYDNGWLIQFQGDNGTMILDEFGVRVWNEPFRKNPEPVLKEDAPVPLDAHIQNFLDCVKSRQEPNATVEVGASAVSAPHLANLAYHQKREVAMP